MKFIKNILPSLLLILIISYTIPSKFSNSEESGYIFYVVWNWIKEFISSWIWTNFIEIWWYLIASIEFIALILLVLWFFNKKLRFYWGFLIFIVLVWAVFSHIFTPLGININNDNWKLFTMAIIWFISSIYIIINDHKSCITK